MNDYFIRTAIADKPQCLVWGLFHRLDNSNLAKDIAALSYTYSDIQKTGRVAATLEKMEMKIHFAKNKRHKCEDEVKITSDNIIREEPLKEKKIIFGKFHLFRQ
jgi:hypothetical protein